jgi:UPF0288 family protein (methanogenesis marker protein 3)
MCAPARFWCAGRTASAISRRSSRRSPPDDPETIARHERGAALYRAKGQELGNLTIARHDRADA